MDDILCCGEKFPPNSEKYRKMSSQGEEPPRTMFCNCCNNEVLVLAVCDIIAAVALVVGGSIGLAELGQEYGILTVVCGVGIGVGILILAFAALLISAVKENKPQRCLPSLVFHYIVTVFLFIFLIGSIAFFNVGLMLPFAAIIAIQCHYIRVVHRFMDGASADSVV